MMRAPRPIPKSIPQTIVRQFIKLRLFWFILVAVLFLSGCVHSDVGVSFSDANHGKIVHHIRLQAQASTLSESIAITGIESLSQRAKALGGRMRHPEAREWVITIPFNNAKDLETKFNRLYQATSSTQQPLPTSQLQIQTLNRLIWQRQRLQYDLDLRSLRATLQNNVSESLDLEFKLKTPWGAQVPNISMSAPMRRNGWQTWQLKPGMMNHIEAVFLVPSPLGIGFVVICLVVIGGFLVKVLSQSGVEIVTAEMD
jgi:Protein of unknown function (DUF3153)